MRTGTEGALKTSHPWRSGLSDISSHRACLGQCFSYSVPNTFPQSTESLVHCDSCMPAQSMWEIVSTAAQSPNCRSRTWILTVRAGCRVLLLGIRMGSLLQGFSV